MNKPLISILMPAYNAEDYIAEAVNSVIAQTYTAWELLVVDDGSTDRTSEILRSLKDSRIKYFYQTNQGQSAARNFGLSHARGEYIAFLDADDVFLPNKLETQASFLETHPECDFSYSNINYFWDGNPNTLYFLRIDHPSGFLKEDLIRRGGHTMVPTSVMFRRKWYDMYGGFEPEFRRSDEYFFYLKMALHGARFCYLNEVLALNRLNRKSLTRNDTYLKETSETNLKIFKWLDKELSSGDSSRKWLPILRASWQLRLALGYFILKDKKNGLRELKKLRFGWILIPIFYVLPAAFISFLIKNLRRLRERSMFVKAK